MREVRRIIFIFVFLEDRVAWEGMHLLCFSDVGRAAVQTFVVVLFLFLLTLEL